ncbi:MAG: biotin--[acetyl-CoA-carboxylase] ligase [Candidatus Woesearchaeota archaeon]|jgi:BirA family biotin operon repressor/biotin-[acetyl-CoA-carboxylase] ligase|nr:biotin--[acetyl-CoA-carboxylase] ligase [Candidatus Woesearchaeota archaeon]
MGNCWETGTNGKQLMLMLRFYNFKTLSSTNDKAKELAKKGQSNLVVIAEKQKKGRGRFGRNWSSEPGGLYMTILLKEKNIDNVRYLTFIGAVSVAKTLIKLSKLDAKVKWPNDVLINDKKVCGILTETICGNENYALVGIGVNINQQKINKSISNKAISLKIITNKNYNIKTMSKSIIREFNNLYLHYKNKKYKKIIGIWEKYSHTLGKKVKAKTLSGTYAGKAIDVDNNCNLILRLNNGKVKKIVEGDIFVV